MYQRFGLAVVSVLYAVHRTSTKLYPFTQIEALRTKLQKYIYHSKPPTYLAVHVLLILIIVVVDVVLK